MAYRAVWELSKKESERERERNGEGVIERERASEREEIKEGREGGSERGRTMMMLPVENGCCILKPIRNHMKVDRERQENESGERKE
ncbi:hypothetical protein QQF64_011855 [Cirrhinus molitorella]|uniref:Uncharacterized protein n=1 Tax=Cirrhinus molitorella TaxID=172907 RepID=A0ABR3LTS7_9TELE